MMNRCNQYGTAPTFTLIGRLSTDNPQFVGPNDTRNRASRVTWAVLYMIYYTWLIHAKLCAHFPSLPWNVCRTFYVELIAIC